jgi:putative ABC transport system permease protein
MAVAGVALAVAVLVTLTAMASGFRIALRSTGRTDNAIVLQKGVTSEVMSDIPVAHVAAIVVDPRISRGADGRPLASPEAQSLVSLARTTEREQVNVAIRAVTPSAFEVRSGIRLVQGRKFEAGREEVIVGTRVRDRFGLEIGSTLPIRRSRFLVVGVFTSEGSGFESEIWGDLPTLAGPLRLTDSYQTVVLRLSSPATLRALASTLESDRRLNVQVRQERQFYEEQAGGVVGALTGLASFVALIMGLGAALAAMNTMNGVVANRTREIATLRALGFSRPAILACFVAESFALGVAGGLLGCALALPANGLSSATSGTNYAEIAFAFRTTPSALASGLAFSAIVGTLGGLLPAFKAARVPIATALRAT